MLIQPVRVHFSMKIFDDFCHCWGLSFISERFKEYRWPVNATQLMPSAKVWCGPPRYCPLRLDLWQLLYHQAPLYVSAQELSFLRSLSWSLVVNRIPLWNNKERKKKEALKIKRERLALWWKRLLSPTWPKSLNSASYEFSSYPVF